MYKVIWLHGDGTPREQGAPQVVSASDLTRAVEHVSMTLLPHMEHPRPSRFALVEVETGQEVYRTPNQPQRE